MTKKEIIFAIIFLSITCVFFFNKIILKGYIPFPGDLLVSTYSPWKYDSYLGYNPGSFPTKNQYFDVIRQIYPWKVLSIDSIKKGIAPLWNPYNFSGSPLLANFQSSVLYPLNIFYFIFPFIYSWTFLLVIQPFIAGIFTYLYAREIGLGKKGSFLSGISYSYSLFMTVFLEYNTLGHTIAWLPFLLFIFEKFIKKANYQYLLLFIFGIVMSFLSGHIQIFGFVIIFVLLYIFARIYFFDLIKKKKITYLVSFCFLTILGLGVCAVQLFPTLELISLSARTNQNYQFLLDKLLVQPSQLILFLSPDFFGNPATRNYLLSDSYPGNAVYIGFASFVFALFSLVNIKKNYFIKFFLFICFVLLLFFLKSPFTQIFYKIPIPFFSTGSPTNAIFLLSFSLSILAGIGLENYLTRINKYFYYILGLIGGLFIIIWLILFILHLNISTKNFIYSTIIFLVFVILFMVGNFIDKTKKIVPVLFIVFLILDLFYFFQKFNPFVPNSLIFPDTGILSYMKKNAGINRFWGYGNAVIEANFATKYNIFSPDGYDPLYPKTYGEFLQLSNNGKFGNSNDKIRSDAVITGGYGENDLPSNYYRLKILDMLGVKYVLDRTSNGSTEKTFPPDRFSLVYKKNEWRIFQNLKAAKRVFLTGDYKTYKSNKEFESVFFSKKFDPAKTILLEEKVNVNPKQSNSNIVIESYKPNKIIFKAKSNTNKLLFLSDTYYPGWHAYIDGAETKIIRADFSFRSIVVPKGTHKIIFEYMPLSFYLGIKTTIISLVALILYLALVKYRKIYEK